MARINDYIWYMPHTAEDGDPPDVDMLQQRFNAPIVALLEEPFRKLSYELKGNDVMVRLDERLDNTHDTFYANVRFIRWLQYDILVRVHFQHAEWAHFLYENDRHKYYINLDRFKVTDPQTQVAVPDWHGRRHTRISNRREHILEHSGLDQEWSYQTPEELEDQLNIFWEKFIQLGQDWLEDSRSL